MRVHPSPAEGDAAHLSPSGRTVLAQDAADRQRLFDVRTGRVVAPTLEWPETAVGRWTGPDTFYGLGTKDAAHLSGIVSCTRGVARCRTLVPRSRLSHDDVVLAVSGY